MTAITTRNMGEKPGHRVAQTILNFIGHIPGTAEKKSVDPAQRARVIARSAAKKAALTAGSLALPPGPLGWLTVLPELVAVWKLQAQMVADIAGIYGNKAELTREQMIMDLQAMWLSEGNTVLFITHGIEEAIFLADRVIVMSPRPGRVDLSLKVEIERPRRWKDHGDPHFLDYVVQVREIFEAKGVLTER